MINKYILLIVWLITIVGCNDSEFKYDPTKLYPELKKGDYWIDKFDQRGLQNATIVSDKLYCNTNNSYKGEDFLYCLNLKDGKVEWKVAIEAFTSQPVEVYDDEIYLSTYTGDLKKISMDGEIIWEKKFPSSYSHHNVNPINGSLIIKSVTNGVYEYDRKTGKQIYHYFFKNDKCTGGLTEPLFYKNQIIFGNAAIDNHTGFIGIDYHSKKILWKCILNEKVHANEEFGLLRIDKYIFAQDFNGILYCIDIETEKKVWSKKMTINNKWVFRFKKELDKLVFHSKKTVALDLATGAEVNYQENLIPIEYNINRGNEIYKIIINDTVQSKGLEIEVKRI